MKSSSLLAVLFATLLGILEALPGPAAAAGSWQTGPPAINLGQCISAAVGAEDSGGPEDLIRSPWLNKGILTSTARRGLGAGKPRGRMQQLDLSDCIPPLAKGCAGEPETLFPSTGGPEEFAPVGLTVSKDNQRVWVADSSSDGVVRGLSRQALTWPGELRLCGPDDEHRARRACEFLTGKVNGLAVSPHGMLVATNAKKKPPIAYSPEPKGEPRYWKPLYQPSFGFANGVAFTHLEDRRGNSVSLALVADFWRQRIHVFEEADDELVWQCAFRTFDHPDNIHLVEGSADKLLIGSFKSFLGALAHLAIKRHDTPAAVWQVDHQPILERRRRGHVLPADCGMGRKSRQLLLEDDRDDNQGRVLSGASVAVKVKDLLVVGQLRRSEVLICPWQRSDESLSMNVGRAGMTNSDWPKLLKTGEYD